MVQNLPDSAIRKFAEAETQTELLGLIYPGDPNYSLAQPSYPISETLSLSSVLPSEKGGNPSAVLETPSKKQKTAAQANTTTSNKEKSKKDQSDVDKENDETIFGSDDAMLEDELIDVEEEDVAQSSDFEPAVKSKAKGKKTPAKTPKASSKASAKRGKAKEPLERGKRRASEDIDDPEKGKKKKTIVTAIKKMTPKGKQLKTSADPEIMSSLADAFPDGYWTRLPGPDNESLTLIDHINEAQPLTLHPSADVRDHGHITSMVQSPDGRMLATFSSLGTVRVWDCETWTQIQLLKDEEEKNIDEFYCGRFTENMDRIVVGGKLKDPLKWSEEDNDNHILPCPLKIFDVMTGKVTERLSGHEEEILCIKDVEFKGEQYFITTSQDGYIIKWKMGSDWSGLQEYTRMEDGETCMAFNVTFLPQCGNKYFLAACDGGVNLFDFELNQKLHTFPQLYSCYCDCVKIVEALDFPPPPRSWNEVLNGDGNKEMFAYAVTRGVEEVEVEGGVAGVNTVPNTVRLHKIVYPTTKDDEFRLEEVKRYQHAEYLSNSWLTKISSNGRYILAPTYDGAVVVFNMASGAVTAVLRDHDGMEVRDVVLGWRSKWIATCSDDGTVKVYTRLGAAGAVTA